MKRIVAIILIAVVFGTGYGVYALDDDNTFVKYQVFTGELNVCQISYNKVLLKKLAPAVKGEKSMFEIRNWNELWIANSMIVGRDGQRISPEEANERFLDTNVKLVVAKAKSGKLKVIYLRIL